MKPIAVVLLSGGLDSTTCLAIADQQGFRCCAISFDYGQRHQHELVAAKHIAQAFAVEQHLIINCDLTKIGGSALTTASEVPKGRGVETMAHSIPVTYVPARNTVFLSYALAWAETLSSTDIFVGVNSVDYSGYPDCRPEYIAAFEHLAKLATRMGTEQDKHFVVHTPLIKMDKSEIIKLGIELGVDYGLTHTCYDPTYNGTACGQCDACLLRLNGFRRAGFSDPIKYSASSDG